MSEEYPDFIDFTDPVYMPDPTGRGPGFNPSESTPMAGMLDPFFGILQDSAEQAFEREVADLFNLDSPPDSSQQYETKSDKSPLATQGKTVADSLSRPIDVFGVKASPLAIVGVIGGIALISFIAAKAI